MKNSNMIIICGAALLLSACQQPYSNYAAKPQTYPYTTTRVVEVDNSTSSSSSSSSSTTPTSPAHPIAKTGAAAAVAENREEVAGAQTAGRSKIPHYSEDASTQQ